VHTGEFIYHYLRYEPVRGDPAGPRPTACMMNLDTVRPSGSLRRPGVLLARVENGLLLAACAGIALMMVVIVADAAMRYLFGSPLSIAYDLTRIYLMPAVVFLALPCSMRERAHIGIEFFVGRFPAGLRRVCHRMTQAIGVIFFSLVAWKVGALAHRAWSTDQVLTGQYTWPLWMAYAVVPVGCSVMALRCLVLPYREPGPASDIGPPDAVGASPAH